MALQLHDPGYMRQLKANEAAMERLKEEWRLREKAEPGFLERMGSILGEEVVRGGAGLGFKALEEKMPWRVEERERQKILDLQEGYALRLKLAKKKAFKTAAEKRVEAREERMLDLRVAASMAELPATLKEPRPAVRGLAGFGREVEPGVRETLSYLVGPERAGKLPDWIAPGEAAPEGELAETGDTATGPRFGTWAEEQAFAADQARADVGATGPSFGVEAEERAFEGDQALADYLKSKERLHPNLYWPGEEKLPPEYRAAVQKKMQETGRVPRGGITWAKGTKHAQYNLPPAREMGAPWTTAQKEEAPKRVVKAAAPMPTPMEKAKEPTEKLGRVEQLEKDLQELATFEGQQFVVQEGLKARAAERDFALKSQTDMAKSFHEYAQGIAQVYKFNKKAAKRLTVDLNQIQRSWEAGRYNASEAIVRLTEGQLKVARWKGNRKGVNIDKGWKDLVKGMQRTKGERSVLLQLVGQLRENLKGAGLRVSPEGLIRYLSMGGDEVSAVVEMLGPASTAAGKIRLLADGLDAKINADLAVKNQLLDRKLEGEVDADTRELKAKEYVTRLNDNLTTKQKLLGKYGMTYKGTVHWVGKKSGPPEAPAPIQRPEFKKPKRVTGEVTGQQKLDAVMANPQARDAVAFGKKTARSFRGKEFFETKEGRDEFRRLVNEAYKKLP